ncbi:DUF3017 domain-containing protein [Modestobacter sp. I12A-02628]|uniref:DUF3017 domain-containing protein n=1 Tax=Goekera deserti TaxID=2497753 RepID=A0A7K3W9K6_9ACTN|nr:DUF3017 domain-containing protein [Goekera deserti]MPR00263.1 DUF3017 domain-containing protein [Goekera deserti]NDI49437.1 DUF3017 domain-containing protein [Goekera deserti]NEL52689.1 DUF3017 domain-containing protein [Goekera deserti]
MTPRAGGTGATRPPLYTRRPVLAGLIRQWPLGVVLLTVGVGLLLVAADFWRRGLITIGLGVAAAGVLRLLLPVRRAGFLAVRSRLVDVVLCLSVGVLLTVFAVVIPAG